MLAGNHISGQCDARGLSNVKDIGGTAEFLVFLKEDGSVVSRGSSAPYPASQTQSFRDVTQLSVSPVLTAGLTSQGRAVVTKYQTLACSGDKWSSLRQIAALNNLVCGLKQDGTIVTDGNLDTRLGIDSILDQDRASTWHNIQSICHNLYMLVGLGTDGTVHVDGDHFKNNPAWCEVLKSWKSVLQVCVGEQHVLALHKDGTVSATGRDQYGQCRVNLWRDIIAVAAGADYSVGITANGELIRTDYTVEKKWLGQKIVPAKNARILPCKLF